MGESIKGAIAGLVALTIAALPAYAQQGAPAIPTAAQGGKLIAVLDLEAVGADRNLAVALSDRLREGLLKTGKFVLVNRDQMDAILNEQAFQQTGCTTQECAVQVGKVLGVREIVSGRVIKLDETHWQLSAVLTSVETAQTLRTETIIFTGDFLALLEKGMGRLAARLGEPATNQKLAEESPPQARPVLPPLQPARLEKLADESPPQALPALPSAEPVKSEDAPSKRWIWWVLGGVLVVGAIASISGSSKKTGGGSSTKSSGTSAGGCTANCTTVNYSW